MILYGVCRCASCGEGAREEKRGWLAKVDESLYCEPSFHERNTMATDKFRASPCARATPPRKTGLTARCDLPSFAPPRLPTSSTSRRLAL